MSRGNELLELLQFWLIEYGVSDFSKIELEGIVLKCEKQNKDSYVIDGVDLDVIDVNFSHDQNSEKIDKGSDDLIVTQFYPIFIISQNKTCIENNVIEGLLESSFKKLENIIEDEKSNNNNGEVKQIVNFEFQICFIQKTPEDSIKMRALINKNFYKVIQSKIKKINGWNKVKKQSIQYSDLSSNNQDKKYHFIQTLNLSPLEIKDFQQTKNGKVYTANLFDIVELYNTLGDNIFSKNVRLGIQDVLDVSKSIKETLKRKPSDFWFLNNGITMYAPKGSVNNLNYSNIEIKNNLEKVSILNGAQTITSAAEFFYEPIEIGISSQLGEEERSKLIEHKQKEINKAKDEAFVLLKIIEMEEANNSNEINTLTISLNRQKPIIHTDIVYTNDKIQEINTFSEEKQDSIELKDCLFGIVRRGDLISHSNHRYTLDSVSRLLCAINLKSPGKARSSSINSILAIKDGKFVSENLFMSSLESTDQNYEDKFKEKYGFVNFGMKLSAEIEKKFRKLYDDEINSADDKISNCRLGFYKYAKYHFTYFIIIALLKYTESKVLNQDKVSLYLQEDVFEKIISIAEKHWDVKEITKESYDKGLNPWDSNMFKKDNDLVEVYNKIIEDL